MMTRCHETKRTDRAGSPRAHSQEGDPTAASPSARASYPTGRESLLLFYRTRTLAEKVVELSWNARGEAQIEYAQAEGSPPEENALQPRRAFPTVLDALDALAQDEGWTRSQLLAALWTHPAAASGGQLPLLVALTNALGSEPPPFRTDWFAFHA